LKQHGIKPPEGYPLALNNAMDTLLKAEFDGYRKNGQPHPILSEYPAAQLFRNLRKLTEWRDNKQGLRWTDRITGDTLFGAIDDILEFPDGTLAVLDYKSSGASEITVYPSYQLQIDVYTFLLQQLGYKIHPKGFFAFFVAVRDDGFRGRLPFSGTIVAVSPQPDRILGLFKQAVALAQSDRTPLSGENCNVCRWHEKVNAILPK